MKILLIQQAGIGFLAWFIIFAIIGTVFNYLKKDKNKDKNKEE